MVRTCVKDYELEVHYHPGKANVVADALSRKAHCNSILAISCDDALCREMEKLNLEIVPYGTLANLVLTPTLRDQIISAQKQDKGMNKIRQRLAENDTRVECFHQ